jgi:hypothetical protein
MGWLWRHESASYVKLTQAGAELFRLGLDDKVGPFVHWTPKRRTPENFFGKLKEFKRIAMRSDKTDDSFEAMIYLATAVIHSRWISTDPRKCLIAQMKETPSRRGLRQITLQE